MFQFSTFGYYGLASQQAGEEEQLKSMKEEFKAYGLPDWFMKVIGSLKVLLASLLVIGIFIPVLVKPAAVGMAVLMLGAIVMHFKIKDAPIKSLLCFYFLGPISVFNIYLIIIWIDIYEKSKLNWSRH
ncbi:MAG: DoxX family protein [Ignavibacteriales bacterium]|nr:DoxX family protein [Ignavibacteriales bacterium]